LAEAIESALQGDERCTLDTMRLIDLLLVLLFEGKFFCRLLKFRYCEKAIKYEKNVPLKIFKPQNKIKTNSYH
jgi:hypothetical protein